MYFTPPVYKKHNGGLAQSKLCAPNVKHLVQVAHCSLCLFQVAQRNACLRANLKCGVGVGAELSQLCFVGFILSSKRSSQMCGEGIMSCGSEGCDRVVSSERCAVQLKPAGQPPRVRFLYLTRRGAGISLHLHTHCPWTPYSISSLCQV